MSQLEIVDNRTYGGGAVVAGQVRESNDGLVVLVVDGYSLFNAVILVDVLDDSATQSHEYKLNHLDDVGPETIRICYPKLINGTLTIGDD